MQEIVSWWKGIQVSEDWRTHLGGLFTSSYLLAIYSDSQFSWLDGLLIFSVSASIYSLYEEPLGAW